MLDNMLLTPNLIVFSYFLVIFYREVSCSTDRLVQLYIAKNIIVENIYYQIIFWPWFIFVAIKCDAGWVLLLPSAYFLIISSFKEWLIGAMCFTAIYFSLGVYSSVIFVILTFWYLFFVVDFERGVFINWLK
jgi:hypothetical protein